ncbi:MAG: hypothetical protein A2Y38_19905 [Spirochaetes bacterium GWB1_59_5]|nr:MAG: hypothetical protein A2Y38_19905 [Spirochaetes bacterium GWB1_59_5]
MPDVHLGKPNTGAVWPGGASKQGPHRVGAFCVCPQLEGFGYELNLRPAVEKDVTVIGTLVHVGLAYRYAMTLAQKPDWLVYPDGRWAIWTCGQHRPDCRAEALRIYDAYCAFYDPLIQRGAVPAWKPLLVEHQFEIAFTMPDGTTEPYTARIDLLAEENGHVILVDHKSKGKIGRQTGNEYASDRQMLTCLALSRHFGFNVERVVINAMTREYPDPRFARYEVPISHAAYNRLGEDTAHALRQMREVRTRYPDPANRPRTWENCIRKFGPCDFIPVCTEGNHRLVEYVGRT